MNSIGF